MGSASSLAPAVRVDLPAQAGRNARGWRRLASRWLVPDLALIVAALTLAFVLFLFGGPELLFRDSDTGWHIRTGESILATGTLPSADPYSLLKRGQAWFAWEWGADVAMGWAHLTGGLAGVALLYAALLAVCSWLWFRLQWALNGHFLVAAAMAPLLISTANIHWLARPHVFSWLLLLGLVWWLESRPSDSWRASFSAVAAGALWANLHASFFLGPVICWTGALGLWLRAFIWNDAPGDEPAVRFRLRAGAGMLAGSLLNPYGWELHRHVAHYLLDRELLARVGEFQSFNFHVDGAARILLTMATVGLGAAAAVGVRRLDHALWMAGFCVLALRSARVLPLVALVGLPLACGAFTAVLERARGLRPAIRLSLDAFLVYGRNLRTFDACAGGWCWAPLILLLGAAVLNWAPVQAKTGFPAGQFPVAAAEELARTGLAADKVVRLLAPDKFGGYLIYRFAGQLPVYFDGRSDFYGTAYMKEYLRLAEARPGWREVAARHGFTHALLPVDSPLRAALEQAGWKYRYGDDVAVLLARP